MRNGKKKKLRRLNRESEAYGIKIKHINIHMTGVSEKEEIEEGAGGVYEEIITKTSQNS